MEIKFKKTLSNAVLPFYAEAGAVGMDLTAASVHYDNNDWCVIDTGIAVEIPEGYGGFIFPRSSITKTDMSLGNCVGVIDQSYRGNILLKFSVTAKAVAETLIARESGTYRQPNHYKVGDRVGQLVIMPVPRVIAVEGLLSETARGAGGFGSTGGINK